MTSRQVESFLLAGKYLSFTKAADSFEPYWRGRKLSYPMIVMNLITLFHNDEVNKNHAQLIFNTHNPIYLNNRLFRRDEIKFVERDKVTKSSSLCALSDFKTNGDISVRKTSDYMKNYFANRYGAIEDVDFTDTVFDMLAKGNVVDEYGQKRITPKRLPIFRE